MIKYPDVQAPMVESITGSFYNYIWDITHKFAEKQEINLKLSTVSVLSYLQVYVREIPNDSSIIMTEQASYPVANAKYLIEKY